MRHQNPSEALNTIVGTKALALEEYYGDIRRVFQAPREELERVSLQQWNQKNLTKREIDAILVAGAAVRDHLKSGTDLTTRSRVSSARDIVAWFRNTADFLEVEQFWVVACDAKNRVIQKVFVSQGSINASIVHPREVFAPLIRIRAYSFFMLHNHPSGDPNPSVEDVEITKRLIGVAEIVGIRVLDHVVIGSGGQYTSFLERGILLNQG